MKTILGIDPGVNGGIAWLDPLGRPAAEKMPGTIKDLWDLIQSINYAGNCVAYLERVSSSPQMGVCSAFTFGNGYGHLEMALTAAGIPFQRVLPNRWQTDLGCRSGGDKNVTKRMAQELFPGIKITHAIADALLIARWGQIHQMIR